MEKMGSYEYKTPGTPGHPLTKPTNNIGILSPEDQPTYRSGVGLLLQFANKTRPDITNGYTQSHAICHEGNALGDEVFNHHQRLWT
jgi:hypothetical protein